MTAAVFAYSRRGCETARRAAAALPDAGARLFAAARLTEDGFAPIPQPSRTFYGDLFAACDALVFVGSSGIAVRMIAPFVRDKKTDPAVIVIDERGRFVIPLLSGHIGGANALAQRLADALGATGVITTATDIRGLFAVDVWAKKQGLILSDPAGIKAVSGRLLAGQPVRVRSDLPIRGEMPEGLTPADGEADLHIGLRRREDASLSLLAPCVPAGTGCRKGIAAQAVEDAFRQALVDAGLEEATVIRVSSVDLKKDEPGLQAFCRSRGLPFVTYPAEELAAVEGTFTPSAFVKEITGTDNVCERTAVRAAGGGLLFGKHAYSGVTVAFAASVPDLTWEASE